MEKTIHEQLVDALKRHTAEKANIIDTLINIIPMSKETAYRRLKGEVQFTLAEACRISEKLSLSIDSMAGIDKKGFHMLHIKEFRTDNHFEKFYELCQESLSVYDRMAKDSNALFHFASNYLFHPLFYRYKHLSRYSFFKWFYQTSYAYGMAKKLEDIVIPEKILNIQWQLHLKSLQVNTCFILGEDIILSLINDVNYFSAIKLVKPDEVTELKNEILCLLDDLENLTKKGHFNSGKKATIYISNAYFDANYSYMKGTNFEAATIYLFGLNQLNCIDPSICEYHKLWIDSLINYSTLISESGRLEGIAFFDRQRKLLNSI